MSIIFDYIRLVGYAVIILSSLRGIASKKFNNVLFLGDCIMAFGLMLASLGITFGFASNGSVKDYILTPAVILWSLIHFYNLVYVEERSMYTRSNKFKKDINEK